MSIFAIILSDITARSINKILFHLAFPVADIPQTKAFYVDGLGCIPGRESPHALILNLYGHQLVAHVTKDILTPQKAIYPRHFGLIFTKEEDFIIGKAQYLSHGTDVSIFACGHLVWTAIEAGKALEAKGISVELINIHTIKPLDEAAVLASLGKTGCAVTAEEHNIIGGLGDSIARTAANHLPVPIEYVGTNDTFGESGKPAELLVKYGLDPTHIIAAAELAIARKNK